MQFLWLKPLIFTVIIAEKISAKAKRIQNGLIVGLCGSTTHNPGGYDNEKNSPSPKEIASGEYPNIKMTKHKNNVKPSGKAFIKASKPNTKQINHGNGLYTVTSQYKNHPDYNHLGIKTARTDIIKMNGKGHDWQIGKIDHVKHDDGSETHTLSYHPSNQFFSGGEIKRLNDAVAKTDAVRERHLKKTNYYNKDDNDHGHGVVFKNK